jgi:hypothetical protein
LLIARLSGLFSVAFWVTLTHRLILPVSSGTVSACVPAAAAADYVVSDRIKNSPLYVAAREFPAGPLSGIR